MATTQPSAADVASRKNLRKRAFELTDKYNNPSFTRYMLYKEGYDTPDIDNEINQISSFATGQTIPQNEQRNLADEMANLDAETKKVAQTYMDTKMLAAPLANKDEIKGVGGFGTGSIQSFLAKNLGYGTAEEETNRNIIGQIKGAIAKMRGGTSFTPNEEALLDSYTPTINDSDLVVKTKLQNLNTFIDNHYKMVTGLEAPKVDGSGNIVSSAQNPQTPQQPGLNSQNIGQAIEWAKQNPNNPAAQKLLVAVQRGDIDPATGALANRSSVVNQNVPGLSFNQPGQAQTTYQTSQPSLSDKANQRADNISQIKKSDNSLMSKALQILGEGTGLGRDVIANALSKIPGAETIGKVLSGASDRMMDTAVGVIPGADLGIGKKIGLPTYRDMFEKAQSEIEELKKKNPEAAKNISAIENIIGLATDIEGLSSGVNAAGKTIKESTGLMMKTAGKTSSAIAKTGKYVTSQAYGLKPETVDNIIKTPGAFSEKEMANIDRHSLFSKVYKSVNDRMAHLSETGKGYETIRNSKQVVDIPQQSISDVLDKYRIDIDRNGRIAKTAESLPMSDADTKALQEFLDVYYNGEGKLSANGILNARTSLSNMAAYESGKTGASKTLAKELRSAIDESAKGQIPELDALDKKYAPEVKLLKKIKKTIFNQDGTVKDNAISTIANLTGKGKEQALARMERIIPGISEDVNILKSIEDIEAAKGQKVGTYIRTGLGVGAGAASGGPVGALIGAIATSPQVGLQLVRAYGKAKGVSSRLIEPIISKMKSGTKLVGSEYKLVNDAIIDASSKMEKRIIKSSVNYAKNIRPGLSIEDISKKGNGEIRPTNLDPKNFKTAEEYVKAQGAPVYHGTSAESAKALEKGYKLLDPKEQAKMQSTFVGEEIFGLSTSRSKLVAQDFQNLHSGGKIIEFYVDPMAKIKILEKGVMIDDIPVEQIKKWKKEGYGVIAETPEKGQRYSYDTNSYVDDVSNEWNHLIIDENAVKTKAQLTDIWNKANQTVDPLIQEAIDYLKTKGKPYEQFNMSDEEFKRMNFISKEESAKMILDSRPSVLRENTGKIGDPWNGETTEMVARERFNIPELKKVSFGGSDRDVYDLGDGNVLKVSKSSRGLRQNQYSVDYYAEDSGLIPKTIENGRNYVVKEKILPPDKNTKKMVSEIRKLHNLTSGGSFNREGYFKDMAKAVEIMEKYGYPGEEIRNYGDILWGDMQAIRNWGTTAEGKPILLDEGTLNGSLIRDYRGTTNMSDPEFAKIHRDSRLAKKKFGDTDKKTMYGIGGAVVGAGVYNESRK